MISFKQKSIYYKALVERNSEYEGLFYVGVKTTGIFCRATCPAKKPKLENCEFFKTAKEAMLASFKPCKRCHPLSHSENTPLILKKLLEAVEMNPEKRWKNADVSALGLDPSTVRRQFKKRFGMTFIEFARARRMGLALKAIKDGSSVIDTQLSTGYESSSGFRDAFSRIMGAAPTRANSNILKATWIDTRLGAMLAIADDEKLYLLEFVDRRGLELEIERLRRKSKTAIIPGESTIFDQIKRELTAYFDGKRLLFETPIQLQGSTFQKRVWHYLQQIPPGETRSYSHIAKQIKQPKAYRAVARANGDNQLAIIIPCHRVINANGDLGGYGGGITRKQWLLDHEKENYKNID